MEGPSGDGLSRVDDLALEDKFPVTGHRSFQSGRIDGRFRFCWEWDGQASLIPALPPDVRWRLCPTGKGFDFQTGATPFLWAQLKKILVE